MPYSEFVKSRLKPGADIKITPEDAGTIREVMRRAVWIGEEIDQVKKAVIYGKLPTDWTREGWRFDGEISADQANMLHIALGLLGEAAEWADSVFKHVFMREALDIANLQEETGDLCFFVEAAAQSVGSTTDFSQFENMEKLTARYPRGYSDKDAIERKDKL